MNKAVYLKLVFTNIRNNRKTYLPYLLTAILTVMMYNMMLNLSDFSPVDSGSVQWILQFSVWVILIFSVIFLFYTNSFLMKRRKKELGIYNILGMGKIHIAKMLTLESLFLAGTSIVGGLFFGMMFGRLSYAIFLKLTGNQVNFRFAVSVSAALQTLLVFLGIFALILGYNLVQIGKTDPMELLRSGSSGEKEPKTKWLLALFGFVMLGLGYGIALTVESPLKALQWFFVAVVCVILATYALFTAGSIAVLKLMRKRKAYYYQPKHFTVVSGMLYRMKQNAVGLANICVLSTMVLVMISTTVSLYAGRADILNTRYIREVGVTVGESKPDSEEKIRENLKNALKKDHVKMESELEWHQVNMTMTGQKGNFSSWEDQSTDATEVIDLTLIPLKDYNKLTGSDFSLGKEEVLLFYTKEGEYGCSEIRLGGQKLHVAEELAEAPFEKKSQNTVSEHIYLIMEKLPEENTQVEWKYLFDLKGSEKNRKAAAEDLWDALGEMQDVPYASVQSKTMDKEDFLGLYGGLFFIGMYLGALFLMATVLIIYYKQISEGYDDRERYQIMQKVGMGKAEVKKSIRSQILSVFFLPLLAAIVHIAVAFPVITKLLAVFYLVNVPLFFWCMVATVGVFAVFYVAVFMITAREYYKIVE